MKKYIFLLIFVLLSGCTNNDNEKAEAENEVEYTKEIYLIETANDVREIRSLHDKLVVQLEEEKEPLNAAKTLMDISILSSDKSYKIVGTESLEFELIKDDLNEIQSFVDDKYNLFSEQKELDNLPLNETITKLEGLIGKLETDFKSVQ